MNNTTKEENPLFPIARKRHEEQYLTFEFDFLKMTPENINTYILGFCGGVGHASGIFTKQIDEMQTLLAELKAEYDEILANLNRKIKELENEKAPTLSLQNPQP